MIKMLIFGRDEEMEYIRHRVRKYAACMTEEQWYIHTCSNLMEMRKLLEGHPMLDMACLDITLKDAVELAKTIRKQNQRAYLILIADVTISPMLYMRPSVKAEGLMMRPLDKKQIDQVLEEAFVNFVEQFQNGNNQDVFVLESREGRRLVDYNRILYFEAREKKMYLMTDTEELFFYDTLDNLLTSLPPNFMRCHRSFLINVHKIERIAMTERIIYLKYGFKIPLSRSYKKVFKELDL